jgi:hypothetical protein
LEKAILMTVRFVRSLVAGSCPRSDTQKENRQQSPFVSKRPKRHCPRDSVKLA